MRSIAAVFVLLLALFTPAQAQNVPTFPDQVYALVGGQPLMLDLYLPEGGPTPRPLLVWIHGGGWSGGSRYPAPSYALALRRFGVAIASISYRLSSQAGQWGSEPVIFPAQIHDVKAAIRWLRAHAADFQIDPNRIGVWGSSAGGHLAALAGTSGNDPELEGTVGLDLDQASVVQVAVDYYGPVDLLNMNPDVTTPPGNIIDHDAPGSPESLLIGYSQPGEGLGVLRDNIDNPAPPFPEKLLLLNQLNPQTWVDANDPPFMIVHGTADMSVPIAQSQRLLSTLTAFGHLPVFLPVTDAGHGGFPDSVHMQAQEFLLTYLISPLLANGFE
jgi:acetyl esterase/lipase